MPDWLVAQPKAPSARLCTVSVAHHTSAQTGTTAAVASLASGPSRSPAPSTKLACTLTVLPTSEDDSVYVTDVSPGIGVSLPPSTSSHWRS